MRARRSIRYFADKPVMRERVMLEHLRAGEQVRDDRPDRKPLKEMVTVYE